jgi:hypothetical protein
MGEVDIFEKLNNFKVSTVSKIMANQQLFQNLAKYADDISEIYGAWPSNNCLYLEEMGIYFYMIDGSFQEVNKFFAGNLVPISYDGIKKMWILVEQYDYVTQAMSCNDFISTTDCWRSINNIACFSEILERDYIKKVLMEKCVMPNLPFDNMNIAMATNYLGNCNQQNISAINLYYDYITQVKRLVHKTRKCYTIVSFDKFFELAKNKLQPPIKDLYFWN